MKKSFFILIMILAFFLITSCASKTYEKTSSDSLNQYRFLQTNLKWDILVHSTHGIEIKGGNMKAMVHIQNLRSESIAFRYKIQWFDHLGNPIGNRVLWKHMDIDGHEDIYLQEVSTVSGAKKYHILFSTDTAKFREVNTYNQYEEDFRNEY